MSCGENSGDEILSGETGRGENIYHAPKLKRGENALRWAKYNEVKFPIEKFNEAKFPIPKISRGKIVCDEISGTEI